MLRVESSKFLFPSGFNLLPSSSSSWMEGTSEDLDLGLEIASD